jgi:Zn-dependent membrane protease YugP
MNLSITDPAFLFPGISLLFLAYTNRYLALASVIRTLNTFAGDARNENREQQIRSLHVRIQLIKFMQAAGVVAFLLCVLSMLALIWNKQTVGEILFVCSLIFMIISLLLSLTEVLKSGQSLKIELNRTHTK